ncbi:Pyridine nucleotide-disulphide oxidoreductase [uncultured virus]|nr:Pyridine nucleotide-disulphide oxidoreductase [uncultured virus]
MSTTPEERKIHVAEGGEVKSVDAVTPEEQVFEVVIIGGGPAALAATLYVARAGRSHITLEGARPGGQLLNTTDIENYPGVGTKNGFDLVDGMRKQALESGGVFDSASGDVERVDFKVSPFRIYTASETPFLAKSVIIATGSTPKRLSYISDPKGGWWNAKTCAVCDGGLKHFKGKPVAVIGGGDSAMEEALFLAKRSKPVYVIHRSTTFKASKVMYKRALAEPNIKFITDTVIEAFTSGEGRPADEITAARLLNTVTKEQTTLELSGVFFAIGHTPCTAFLGNQVKLSTEGYIELEGRSQQTNVTGVFAAGDVHDHVYRQAITAAGAGAAAGIEADRYL